MTDNIQMLWFMNAQILSILENTSKLGATLTALFL